MTDPVADAAADQAPQAAPSDVQNRWMSSTLQLNVQPLFPPAPPMPDPAHLQLTDPSANFGAPPPPASPLALTPPGPVAAAPDPLQPTLERGGLQLETEGTRPPGPGAVQLFPSARLSVQTPYTGGPIGPDLRGPITTVEGGATILQLGGEKMNAQLRASIEAGDDGLTPHATLHLERKLGPVHVELEGDTTGDAQEVKAGFGGTF